MTIQLQTASASKSKKTLQEALTKAPVAVWFNDPSIFNPRTFSGAQIEVGQRFPIVMDPATRRRFATVSRTAAGFKVT